MPALTELWSAVVMPHIGVLTLLLGLAELAAGAGLLAGARRAGQPARPTTRLTVVAMTTVP